MVLTPQPMKTAIPTTSIFGLPIAQFSIADLLKYFQEMILKGRNGNRKQTLIAYINARSCNLSLQDSKYRAALAQADLLYLDGNGPRIAAWCAGRSLPPRLTGADWFDELCGLCEQHGFRVYFLGSKPGVTAELVDRLQVSHPSLEIAGHHHGYFSPEEEPALIEAINDTQPDLLILGLGSPYQEYWMVKCRERLAVPVIWGGGGVLDYASGNVKRAPRWMRAIALEWFGRMLIEPRRLTMRYLLGIPMFLYQSVKWGISTRTSGSRR